MGMIFFIKNQFLQIREGGFNVLWLKLHRIIKKARLLPVYLLALPFVILIRIATPFFLIRIGGLMSSRIGHLSANTEIYLCEKEEGINMPDLPFIDLFFAEFEPVCNYYLIKMWGRILHIWPRWILEPIRDTNRLFPGWGKYEVGTNTQHDRDVHNLIDKYPVHLNFTMAEEELGKAKLSEMGIPSNKPFVCLLVRDSAYLDKHKAGGDWSYHNFRDCDVQNFVLASEYLADQGYYVIRMGKMVKEAMKSDHPKVIDYATSGYQNDFTDIYLGAKCAFCITTGAGWDGVPAWIFRRPTIFTNLVPIGYLPTFSAKILVTTKKHVDMLTNHELSLSEIFSRGTGFCMESDNYTEKGVRLVENSPEVIKDIVVEMTERINGTWKSDSESEYLQQSFRSIYATCAIENYTGSPLHGEIRSNVGLEFLKSNKKWIQ